MVTPRTPSRRTPHHPTARIVARLGSLLTALTLAATTLAGPALAVGPLDVVGEITDQVGALEGRDAEVQSALDRLTADTPLQLFVVYVDSFDGLDGLTWANETAIASGLGVEDLLLAVATEDRRYGVSVDDAVPLTPAQLDDVRTTAIEPALSDDDWAGAAIAAADGYRQAYSGPSGTDGQDAGGSGSGFLTFVTIALVVVAVVVVIVVLFRRGKRGRGTGPIVGPDGVPVPADSPRLLPTPELDRRASAALVAIDDALTTSQQELGFAQAQFGTEATRAFAGALEEARSPVARAFRLRQQLDDSVPESEPQAREMMIEIVEICEHVSDTLDEHAEEFDKLRKLEAQAPRILDETEQRAEEVRRRVEPARAQLRALATTYPAEALASVAANPDQAEELLDAALAAVGAGREELASADRSSAVAQARIAEDAVAQSVTLLDAVDRARQDLATAQDRLTTALASISADVSDADRLVANDAGVRAAADVARTRIAEGQAAREGGDVLAALRNLIDAEAALDAALAPARAADERARRAAALLDSTVRRVNAQVRGVTDFIDTRRGAVGPEPRTRLAEASRLLGEAAALRSAQPELALQNAQQAEQLAQQAQALAQRDVQAWEQTQRGGYQGGGYRPRRRGPSAGSLVLGGILLDQMVGGRSRGGFGRGSLGGFSGRGVGGSPRRSGGGSFGGSRRSAGSFGGGRTRGRRGGGGRF